MDRVLPQNYIVHKGCHLWMDNLYSRIKFYNLLHEHWTLCDGTVRVNQCSTELKNARLAAVGDSVSFRCGNLLALKFRDKKREVCMLSTLHDESSQAVRRRNNNQPARKPKVIVDYNKNMGAVDRSDQLIQPYDATRKTWKWYRKLATHLLQV